MGVVNLLVQGKRGLGDTTPQYYFAYNGSGLVDWIRSSQAHVISSVVFVRANLQVLSSYSTNIGLTANLTIRGNPHRPIVVDWQETQSLIFIPDNVTVTLLQLELVNLPPGNSASAATALGSSISGVGPMWLFSFPR